MSDADTLRMLEDAARSLASFDAGRVRGWREQPPGFDRAVWRSIAEQGWLGILVAEDDGGLGLDLDAAAVVARALGTGCFPEPFVAAGIVAPVLLSRCPAGSAKDALPDVVTGETIVALADLDPAGRCSAGTGALSAVATGGSVRLDGECRFVPVPHADAFVAAASSDGGLALYWVPRGTPGVTISEETTADGGRTGWLRLTQVELAGSTCLASGDAARSALDAARDLGVLGNCAELLGIMDRCLALTLDYLKTRKQFGKPIGSFQVLQHRAVDLWMLKEVSEHATNAGIRTAMAPGVPPAARAIAASSAKARVGEAALRLVNEAIQLHGAIGFTDEYDLALYSNRALAIAPFLGNAAEHRKRYADLKARSAA